MSGSLVECLVILVKCLLQRLTVYTYKMNSPRLDQGLSVWKLCCMSGNPCEVFGTKVDCVDFGKLDSLQLDQRLSVWKFG